MLTAISLLGYQIPNHVICSLFGDGPFNRKLWMNQPSTWRFGPWIYFREIVCPVEDFLLKFSSNSSVSLSKSLNSCVSLSESKTLREVKVHYSSSKKVFPVHKTTAARELTLTKWWCFLHFLLLSQSVGLEFSITFTNTAQNDEKMISVRNIYDFFETKSIVSINLWAFF